MEGRTLVIGDIHGALRALHQVLERAQVTPEDQLIFLGDYVDGWSESPQTINFLIGLTANYSCIFIRGNHDDLCCQWLKFGKDNPEWLFHGGQTTVDAYSEISEADKKQHVSFLESLQDYYINEANKLFVHAGFTNQHGVEKEYFSKMFYWDRSLWETALSLDPKLSVNDTKYPKRLLHYNEIFIGHTPTIRIGETTPVNAANIWNIDTGAAYKSPLTIMDVDTKQFWQSDNVNELYPDENGRN
ncbi:metallophosphoesterase family protein [Leptobacterium sp. I13]|uniref:metallophosphoesterase family protein n=1 Tax=Leptobacterium meishanense TaxID=3128904 RepID=UPI0030EDA1D0